MNNYSFYFSGFVDKTNVENYQLSREKFAKKCRNNSNFQRAVDEMDKFIFDPQKYKSNAVARVIKIKNEVDIERNLGIKVERTSIGDCIPKEKSATPDEIDVLKVEKVNFIEEIVSLKSVNQQVSFQLNKQKKELTTIKMEHSQNVHKLNQEIAKISSDLKIYESEITKLKKKYSEEKANDKKIIDKLVFEKNQLTARVKQLQTCTLFNDTQNDEQKHDEDVGAKNVYEVDKLIADEMVGKICYYLVRWKGYGRDDDTWEKEKNLSCPTILEAYKKQKLK